MKFTCELKGQSYMADAQQVGGYTMVYVWCNRPLGGDKVVFQLFQVDELRNEVQSTPAFLERAARVALAQFDRIYPPFERANTIAYNVETPLFSENLKPE